MVVTDEMVEKAMAILFPLNAAFNKGSHESLKAKTRNALDAAIALMRGQSEELERDAARYRWLRNRAINFGLDDESGTPYCVYGIGAGDANPTDGEELDNMIDHCAEIDAAKEQAP